MKYYHKPWFTVLTLLLFFPVGLFLMWKNKHFGKLPRVIISIFFGLVFLFNVFSTDPSTSTSQTSTINNEVNKDNKQSEQTKKTQQTRSESKSEETSTTTNNNSLSPTKTLDELKIHFIDVGQADSILVQSADKSMLIDAGNNADSDLVVGYINKLGIKHLDYVVGSHPHEDHVGGLDSVINSFDIGKVMLPKATSTTTTYKDVLTAIKNKGLKITVPTPGTTFKLGDSTCTVLAPNSSGHEDVNDYSIVIKVVHGSKSFLLTADAEQVSEKEMLGKSYDLKADILKVGHHGSSSSTSDSFLDKVQPKYAVISVGDDNKYGHPTQETLDRLKSRNIPVYRTDETGTIIVSSDGKDIKFNVAAGSYKGHVSAPDTKPTTTSSTSSPKKNSSSSNTVVVTKPKPSKPISKTAYWTPRGKSYHFDPGCRTLKRSKTILSGTVSEAISSGHADPCDWCAQ